MAQQSHVVAFYNVENLFDTINSPTTADEDMLRERLIGRKMKTGMMREDAERFVESSDMRNVRLCLDKTMKADLELSI